MMFRKRHAPAGAVPGTLVLAPDASPPRVRVLRYDSKRLSDVTVEDVAELVATPDSGEVAWIDVQGLGDESVLKTLAHNFAIHALALEDVVHEPQRPKAEEYPAHHFMILHMLRLHDGQKVASTQLGLFIGRSHVLTFHEGPAECLEPVRRRLQSHQGQIRDCGADYLGYVIMDAVVDAYFPVVEMLGDRLETLEELALHAPTLTTMRRINRIRKALRDLRRMLWPTRDAINRLLRDSSAFVSERTRLHLRDIYDHCVQMAEVTETYREFAADLVNTYHSGAANRSNEVMKVLTILASIFIPLTFLTGIYGMNFEFMPELHYRWSYFLLLGTMAALAAGMLLLFRRRGWIGGGDDGPPDDGDGPGEA